MRYAVTRFCLLLLGCSLCATATARAEQIEVLNAGGAEVGMPDGNLVDSEILSPTAWGHGQPAVGAYPGWYASGDALFLHRNHARDLVISVNDRGTILDTADDFPLLTTNDLGFQDFETGYRVELGRSLGHGLALEGSFFQIREWDAYGQVTSNGLLNQGPEPEALSPPISFFAANFDADPFFQALQHTATYMSDVLSAEMNLKAAWQYHSLTGAELYGFRYFRLRERFTLVSQDEAFSTPTDGFGTYDTETDNDLFGFQYGQEASLQLHSLVCMQTKIRAGLFLNNAEQRTQVISNAVLVNDIHEENTDIAFVGELNVNFKFNLTRWASARAGYNFLWVEGVALAPEQDYPLALTGFNQLNDGGGLFLHGFNIGVELSR
jgi:hypothetical protein